MNVQPFSLTTSGVVASQSTKPQPVYLHGMVLTESGGSTDLLIKFYGPPAPTAGQDNSNYPVASAGGVEIFQLNVPKGTTIVIPPLGDEGMYFKDGVYIALSGGTSKSVIGYS